MKLNPCKQLKNQRGTEGKAARVADTKKQLAITELKQARQATQLLTQKDDTNQQLRLRYDVAQTANGRAEADSNAKSTKQNVMS